MQVRRREGRSGSGQARPTDQVSECLSACAGEVVRAYTLGVVLQVDQGGRAGSMVVMHVRRVRRRLRIVDRGRMMDPSWGEGRERW